MKNLIYRALWAEKTKISTLLFAVVANIGTIFADAVQIGDLYYNLVGTGLTAEVTYKSYNKYSKSYNDNWSITEANIPQFVTYKDKQYVVRSIGKDAFSGCADLTSVTIGNSVTSIGDSAFYGCTGLTSIEIPYSVTRIEGHPFVGCTGLTSPVYNERMFAYLPTNYSGAYAIPTGIESIANYAFDGCSSLTSIDIPNSVTSIGSAAFRDCTGLTSIDIPGSITSIGSDAFYGCSSLSVTIGDGITNIWHAVFMGCSGLTSVTIPNSVTSIGSDAFHGCSSLTSINIPNSVTSIESDAFHGCSSLPSITIPNSVTSIGSAAFSGCTGLTSVTIGDGITSIKVVTFSGCSSLTSINIPNSVTSIESDAFYGCTGLTSIDIPNSVTSIESGAFYGCSSLTSIDIPNSVTSIGSAAFYGCTGLPSITIPNSVTSIGQNAFLDCTTSVTINSNAIVSKSYKNNDNIKTIFGSQVTEYIIGDSVSGIGKQAFEDCSGLTSVTIPYSVTSIGGWAFSGCSGLTSVTCYAKNPPELGSSVFYNVDCSQIPLYVPAGSISAYQTADQWKDFGLIQPIPSAEGIETSDVTATPLEDNSVTLEWPVIENAVIYTIDIKKNGELICTLEFDENGLLLSKILYMPSRKGDSRQTPSATQTVKGWRYTVEGLEAGAEYSYTITAKKEDESVLFTQSIDFTLPAPQGIDDINAATKSQKIVRDYQVLILRGDKTYTLTGQEVK